MKRKVEQLKNLALERSNLSIIEADGIFKANRADELVWQMAKVAHEILDMNEEVDTLYGELVPFLNYLVRNYPQLKGA